MTYEYLHFKKILKSYFTITIPLTDHVTQAFLNFFEFYSIFCSEGVIFSAPTPQILWRWLATNVLIFP